MTSYHGWTHAPKEQGGTDPIPIAASGFTHTDVLTVQCLDQELTTEEIVYDLLEWTMLSDEFCDNVGDVKVMDLVEGQVEIYVPGFYMIWISSRAWVLPPGVDTIVDINVFCDTGSPNGKAVLGGASDIMSYGFTLRHDDSAGGSDHGNYFSPLGAPFWISGNPDGPAGTEYLDPGMRIHVEVSAWESTRAGGAVAPDPLHSPNWQLTVARIGHALRFGYADAPEFPS